MKNSHHLAADDVADTLQTIVQSLANWRATGEGPEYFRRRSQILNALSAIERHIASIEIELTQVPTPVAAEDNGVAWLTAGEAAELLRASAATLARWRTQGWGRNTSSVEAASSTRLRRLRHLLPATPGRKREAKNRS